MKCFIFGEKAHPEITNRLVNACDKYRIPSEMVLVNDGGTLTKQDIARMTRFPACEGLTRRDIALALGHIHIYQTMIKENITTALVLADDVILQPDTIASILEIARLQSPLVPVVTLLGKIGTYRGNGSVSIPQNRQWVFVVEADMSPDTDRHTELSRAYILNRAAAEKLYEFLYPIWLEVGQWDRIGAEDVVVLRAVVPSCVQTETLTETLGGHEKPDTGSEAERIRHIRLQRTKKNKSLYLKIKHLFWRWFLRPFSDIRSS